MPGSGRSLADPQHVIRILTILEAVYRTSFPGGWEPVALAAGSRFRP